MKTTLDGKIAIRAAIYVLAQLLREPQENIVVVMVHAKQPVPNIHVPMLNVNVILVGLGKNANMVIKVFPRDIF